MGMMLIFTPIIGFMFACVELLGAAIGLGAIITGIILLARSKEFRKRNIFYIILIIAGAVFLISSIVALAFTYYICREMLIGIVNY